MVNIIFFLKDSFLKRKGLSGVRLVSIIQKNMDLQYNFVKIHKDVKVNIWWMIKCDLLKLLFISNVCSKIVCRIYSSVVWYTKKGCVTKTRNVFKFQSQINNSVVIVLSSLSLSISAIISLTTINVLIFSVISSILFQYSIKTLESLKCSKLVFSLLLISKWYMDLYHINKFYQYPVGDL